MSDNILFLSPSRARCSLLPWRLSLCHAHFFLPACQRIRRRIETLAYAPTISIEKELKAFSTFVIPRPMCVHACSYYFFTSLHALKYCEGFLKEFWKLAVSDSVTSSVTRRMCTTISHVGIEWTNPTLKHTTSAAESTWILSVISALHVKSHSKFPRNGCLPFTSVQKAPW